MAGQNHRLDLDDRRLLRPHPHHHRHLPPPDIHLIEDRIAAQHREIETLLHDNQRIATTHVALSQDLTAAQQELRRLSAAVASAKAETDARVREVYDRSLKLEAEARAVEALPAELDRVRAHAAAIRAERKELAEKLMDIEADIKRTLLQLQQQMPALKAEIESTKREIQRGKAAIEYERKMHSSNFGLSEAMEKHMVSLAREAEELRSQLAEKRSAMAMHQGMNREGGVGYGGIGNPETDQNYGVHQAHNPDYGQYGPTV